MWIAFWPGTRATADAMTLGITRADVSTEAQTRSIDPKDHRHLSRPVNPWHWYRIPAPLISVPFPLVQTCREQDAVIGTGL